MKRFSVPMILATAISLQAASPPRGNDRLLELVVFPEIKLSFSWGIDFEENKWVVSQAIDLPSAIAEQREKLNAQTEDVRQTMHLAYLLASNNETNEAELYYQKAEQFCRNKIAVSSQDGLNLIALGEILDALGSEDEAESNFRKAILVSSNEWKCWIGLGNYLANDSFDSLFSKDLLNMVVPGQAPSKAVLNYRPSPETLKKSESLCREASRCFDRAVAIAPKEPEVFFQRAGYMSISNLQNCYIRYYRNNEKISTNEWVLAFFSKETILNLKQAAKLKPKDYQYISLAAYFEYSVSAMQLHLNNDATEILPDKISQSIHEAMTRLENLSKDSDNKTAAGALENLGMLNMCFGNSQAAASDSRRAVSLDPTRETSWDLLLGTMVYLGATPEEIVSVCQTRLKYEDSARNRLLLAKALTKEEKWDEAAIQAGIAGKIETNNIVPPLLIAAIALKDTARTNYLTTAKIYTSRANAILQTLPVNDENAERWRELALNAAIVSALTGEPEKAKQWANFVLKRFPGDETAKSILTDLD
jgi:tetratricopeptide (TPR) repeat protein